MKRLIQNLLWKLGWEVRRAGRFTPAPPRASTLKSLEWLAQNGFGVETVLDVGASDGRWSRDCMDHYPQAGYMLFEPQPVHADALEQFAASCHNAVIIVDKAVGAREGVTHFVADTPFGGALADSASDQTIEVGVTTVDAAVTAAGVDGPFLLKLDTHGFETGILEGAANVLQKASVLIIEAYNYRITDEAVLFWELCHYLEGKGFSVIDLVDVMHREHDGSLWQIDLVFVRTDWPGFGYTEYQ